MPQSITYGLFHLATHPALIGPLVEEATRTIGEKGWSKSSLDSMRLLESFERENLRYHGAGVCTNFPSGGVLGTQRLLYSDNESTGREARWIHVPQRSYRS